MKSVFLINVSDAKVPLRADETTIFFIRINPIRYTKKIVQMHDVTLDFKFNTTMITVKFHA